MTALEKAFAEAAKLPESEQEEFAAWLLEELASEHHWQQSLHNTQDLLTELADEALVAHSTGRSETLDPDHL
ncbi:MAG: hypothetical protein GY854_06030 [Deltaproteobacteria bacterium]|nr:hypothetical protein [Deltaproteobacteria bacterium]